MTACSVQQQQLCRYDCSLYVTMTERCPVAQSPPASASAPRQLRQRWMLAAHTAGSAIVACRSRRPPAPLLTVPHS
jgi:hypothetical protein